MAMISGGDESARNAFRAYLRDDGLAADGSSQLSLISTEEMSPGDVLEVRNLADAIERAERALRESSRPRDMFADLGGEGPVTQRSPGSIPVPTDDASGPAVYAKPTLLTPLPPALRTTPVPTAVIPASASTRPLPVIMVPNEEDAFLQPAGRMRHFAEETLDGYRPESTIELNRGARRKVATVVVGALLGVLAIAFGAGVVMACMPAATKLDAKSPPAVVTLATAQMEGPKAEAPKPEAPNPAASSSPSPSVPTMNVNDLPSAR